MGLQEKLTTSKKNRSMAKFTETEYFWVKTVHTIRDLQDILRRILIQLLIRDAYCEKRFLITSPRDSKK